MPTQEQIEGYLQSNTSWTLGCPGIPGKDYRECLDAWKVKKIVVLRKIIKDLGELYAQDDTFATEVFSMVARQIATTNWQFKSGPFPVWNAILSKAKNVAKKKLTGKTDLDELSKGLLHHAQAETRTSAGSSVSGSSPGFRG